MSYDDIPDFGRLYDAVPLYQSRKDVAFYIEEAKRAAGPVLELGCGTGRVLIPTARAGVRVTGLDASSVMLDRCRERLSAEPADVAGRVTLHEGDARRFSLGETFALITAPFRSFQHCTTIDDQLAYLGCAAKHLAPGGRLVFDVFNVSFPALTKDRTQESEDTPELTMDDGRRMRRTGRVRRVRYVDQVSECELVYYVTPHAGAPPDRFVHAFEMRWVLRDELRHLLARAGLRVAAMYGDYDRSPLTDSSPDIVVVAERA